MRYITLGEALVIAEAVTGIDAATLVRASRVELLDSALNASHAGFGDHDLCKLNDRRLTVAKLARTDD